MYTRMYWLKPGIDSCQARCYHSSVSDVTSILEKAMIRTQIQLNEEQSRRLKDMAAREKVSMAELMRQAVDLWLLSASPVSVEERRQRTLAIVGCFGSGVSDVSERHDEYLAEAYGGWSSS